MNILALTYWSYREPLIQAATIPHLKTILSVLPPGSKIFLLTLEKKHLRLSDEEKTIISIELKKIGIIPIFFNYHRFGIRAAVSWMLNLWKLRKICKKENIVCLHAFGTPVGAATYILSRFTGLPFVTDSYEPHAEAMTENKTWKKKSLAYRLLFHLEKMQTKHSAAVLPASHKMNEYAAIKYNVLPSNSVTRPATVDTSKFRIPDEHDYELKNRLYGKKIIGIYAGKFGGIYLEDEVFLLINTAYKYWESNFCMVILSDVSQEYITHKCKLHDIPDSVIHLKSVKHEKVSEELRLADFAINPVKPVPSKKYCTSIKDGEYWASGLPVIITPGIADDSDLIIKNRAGVLWESLDYKGCMKTITELDNLLSEDRKVLSARIRSIALQYRDSKMNNEIYSKIYGSNGIIHLKIKRILVLIYNSFGDPLFQNLMLQYIKTQSLRHPNFRFDLLTFEQKDYAFSRQEQIAIKTNLSADRIYWHPLQYHSGNFLLIKKLFDFFLAAKEVFLIRLKAKPEMIFSFANAAAAIGIVLAWLFRTRHMVYSYEPHSEFLVDFGVWRRQSIKYMIMSRLERLAGKYSDVILTGTSAMKNELERTGSKAQIFRAPSAVDENIFKFDNISRENIRTKLEIKDRKVIIYVGKFGGIYYEKEIAQFLSKLWFEDNSFFFIILSPNPAEEVSELLTTSGLSPSNFYINRARSAREVVEWNSAADIGLNAIPPLPNQKYRSPVKVAEYLLCGLPYIVCKGVSEDDIYARTFNVGLVVPELSEKAAADIYPEIINLLKENKEELRSRCRKTGLDYRSKEKIDALLDKILFESN